MDISFVIINILGGGPYNLIWWILLLIVPVVFFVIYRLTIWKNEPGIPSGKVSTVVVMSVILIGLVALIYLIWIGYETYTRGGFEQLRDLHESK